ncbi:MAG: AAA family ATPase, partial [Nannocystaceae bacterium]
VSPSEYRQRLDEMVELLDLGDIVARPVRQLSLGERMKCELVAALLHRPKIVFLDEPTLGMDVTMQLKIRHFIRDYNERYGATVVLTSHYMGDVAALCSRVLLIADGALRFDGDIDELVKSVRPVKRVAVTIPDKRHRVGMSEYGLVVKREERVVLDVERSKVSDVIAHLLSREGVRDLEVTDPPLEEVLREVFERRRP